VVVLGPSAKPIDFVREIPTYTIKALDLADVVADGDGFGTARGRGIDPTTGQTAKAQPVPRGLTGDHKYHRVESLPLIDGVFVPDGGQGPVQVDSAGHAFDGFGATDNLTCGHVWAGGPVVFTETPDVIRTELGGIEYGSPGHGVLAMHANKAITFDLEAIRRANSGCKVVRFRSVAGNPETASQEGRSVYGDIWVLVDGRVRFQRREINAYNGAMSINVLLGERDRFLTLVATDGGNGASCDWIMFGDPRLELQVKQERAEETKGKHY
jgi:hypothetical protein